MRLTWPIPPSKTTWSMGDRGISLTDRCRAIGRDLSAIGERSLAMPLRQRQIGERSLSVYRSAPSILAIDVGHLILILSICEAELRAMGDKTIHEIWLANMVNAAWLRPQPSWLRNMVNASHAGLTSLMLCSPSSSRRAWKSLRLSSLLLSSSGLLSLATVTGTRSTPPAI